MSTLATLGAPASRTCRDSGSRDQDLVKTASARRCPGRRLAACRPTACPGSRCCAATPPRRTPAARRPCTRTSASAVVDCGVYDEGHRQGGVVELETALRKADACQDGFVWIGLHDPSPEVVEAVGKRFELHPLAVEDAVNAHQRPKLEVFGDTLFLVLKTARHVNSERAGRDRRGDGVRRPALRGHRPPRRGQPAARRAARPRGASRPPRHRAELRPLRRRRPHRRRLRRGARAARHRGRRRRGRGLLARRRQPDRADLQAQARGARVQARRWRRSSRRCSASPPTRPGCRSIRAPRPTSATSTTT